MRAHVIKDGVVINTIVVDSLDFMPGLISGENGGQIGDLWNGETFATPEPPPAPAMKKISRLAFYHLFTPAELSGIYTAAKSIVDIEILLDQVKVAEFIDLDDERTIAAVQGLESGGLIAAGRAAAILS